MTSSTPSPSTGTRPGFVGSTTARCSTTSSPEAVGDREWVFDHPFFIILNLALGGTLGGTIALDTKFPQYMYVDYVQGLSARLTGRVSPHAGTSSAEGA